MAKKPPQNTTPVAASDSFTANEDTSLAISAAQLLANDADANGDVLSLLSVGKSEHCSVSLGDDGNVVFKADKNFSGQASFSYTVSDGNGGKATATVYVYVAAVADGPKLTVADSQGREDGEIKLHINAALTDKDGSESLKVFVSGVPEGASLSAGERQADGSWALTAADLKDLSITPAANSSTDFTLTVRAVSTEFSNGSRAESVDTLHVTVNANADVPVLVVTDAVGVVDAPIALDIRAALTDVDGSEQLLIEIVGVPKLATLSAGVRGDNGVWTLTEDQLDGLTLTSAPGSERDFHLKVRAIAIEESNGDSARLVQTLHVTVNPGQANHAPVAADDASPASEDQASVTGNVLANDHDSDAGSTLSVAAPGLRAGAYGSLELNPDGSYTYMLGNVDALAAGQTVHDSFTYQAKDQQGALSASATLTVSITGTNDAAVLGAAVVTLEETDAPLTTGGTLSISDVDSPSAFIAQEGTTGTYGSFSIDAAGTWTYMANSAFDELNSGDSRSDSFTVAAADGTTTSVKVTISGTNDAAVLSSAAVALDETNAALTTGGTLAVSDVDNPSQIQAQDATAGAYGSFTIDANGAWTYSANSAFDGMNVGDSVSDSFVVHAIDGTVSTVQVSIHGSNDAAVLSSAVVVLDETDVPLSTGGTLSISDADSPAQFVAQQDTVGAHGRFSIEAGGTWSYAADSAFNDLKVGDAVTDTFAVSAADGTLTSVQVSISGANDGPVAPDHSAATSEDTPLQLSSASLLAGVTDADLGDSLTLISVGGATNGAASLADGLISFVPGTNFNGAASFTYTVADGSGATANATVAVTVVPVNDAPSGSDKTVTTVGTAPYTLAAADFGFSDPSDGDHLLGVRIASLPGAGTLSNGGVTVVAGQVVLADDIAAGMLRFTPSTGALGNGYASFTFQVQDSGGHANGGSDLDATPNVLTVNIGAQHDLFDGTANNVDFDQVVAGGYAAGTQYNALGGDDVVLLPSSTAEAAEAGFVPGTVFLGGAGNDTITGRGLNDSIDGGAGNDTLSGGAGIDTLSYASATAFVSVDLSLATAQDTRGAGIDIISGFENLIGTAFSDTLLGNAGDNIIDGGAGSDTISGGAGNDDLRGGAGTDTAYYGFATAGVTVSLALTTAQNTGGAGVDILSGFENLTGSPFDDVLAGDAGNNTIIGGAGNDTVTYAAAAAGVSVTLGMGQITGGAGTDLILSIENLIGSSFNDVLAGDAGNNIIDGGGGKDTLSYASAAAGVTVSLAVTSAQATGGAGTDTIVNFENLTGSSFNDLLSGNAGDNVIVGGAGVDTLSYAGAAAGVAVSLGIASAQNTGEAGIDTVSGFENLTGSNFADVLAGDAGNNIIDGGGGEDTLSYASAAAGVTVSLAVTGAQATGGAGTDTIVNFENLTGSSFNDVLTGNAGNNVIVGGAGNNVIDGGGGQDTLSYAAATALVLVNMVAGTAGVSGQGNDVFSGIENITGSQFNDSIYADSGSNVIVGGDGTDTLSYEYGSTTAGVTVNLANVGAQNTGGSGFDSISGIERLTGSAFNDVLTGDSGDNLILGRDGDDVIDGGLGDDVMFGNEGTNTLSYASATSGVTVSLLDSLGTMTIPENTGGAGSDLYYNFANLSGSAFGDVLSSDDVHKNVIDGGAGNDLVHGDRFGDTSVWGDTYIGGSGTDTLSFASAWAAVRIDYSTDPAHPELNDVRSDVLVPAQIAHNQVDYTIPAHLEVGVIAAHSGFEAFTGSDYDDSFFGDQGNWAGVPFTSNLIIFEGGLGNDQIIGGFGNYVASYASAPGPVTVDARIDDYEPQNTGSAGLDTLIRISGLIGSAYDDVLLEAYAFADGGTGNDRIQGNFRSDPARPEFDTVLFDGGLGVDTFVAVQDLDLSSWQGDHIKGFEIIDLSSSGSQKLTLSASDLLDLSDTDQLMVRGNASDSVDIDLASWTHSPTDVTVAGVLYESYTSGLANLLVQNDVPVI